jgi:hypothetical protein
LPAESSWRDCTNAKKLYRNRNFERAPIKHEEAEEAEAELNRTISTRDISGTSAPSCSKKASDGPIRPATIGWTGLTALEQFSFLRSRVSAMEERVFDVLASQS